MSTIIKIQHLRGTAAQWTSRNPVLPEGELGVETDTLYVKVGDGIAPWNNLPYIHDHAGGGTGGGGSLTLSTTQTTQAFSTSLVGGANTYVWNHANGQYPIIKVLDSNGEEVELQITHPTVNQTVVETVEPFSGTLLATVTQTAQVGISIVTSATANGDYSYTKTHSAGQYPIVRLLDSNSQEIDFQIVHTSANEFTIYTASTISGTLLIN